MLTVPEYFGSLVFDSRVMKARLPADVYRSLKHTIQKGAKLDPSVANAVAAAMKDWAVENGATHFTHWFQPLTGITAEKHDSFITPAPDGRVLMEFSGKELIKGEPDASSFPSGGLRATFEARGYTAWDPTSYAFIKGKTLCIPTAFCSYGGEALDKKTPLLRSMEALNKQALRILKLFGHDDVRRVTSSVGPEQEYFLIDKAMYDKRRDLIYTGRTLFGARPPKGQELDDHYFGSIKPRVAAYMEELNEELWKLGILAKTEHNEVAPAQHELAPIYTPTNIATDHNQLTMEIMQRVAAKHGLVCLLHEKPFAGVNGSGKHNNWSIATDTGINLLSPGETPYENAQFLLFLVAVIQAVDDYQGLLRAAVATAGNDHRLGANEAPPAIISIFLGAQISAVLEKLEASRSDAAITFSAKNMFKMSGISHIPTLMLDNTDRNRTSPFAFTGNRFEFRAVGSSDNCADAMLTLNTAVAEQLTRFKEAVDRHIESGMKKEKAIYEELKKLIRECKPIHFDGNGYSDEWKAEAARRGLDCETSTPLIFDRYLTPDSIRMFESTGVLNKVEIEARTEVKWETYTKKIQIEGRVLGDLTMNHIVPIASRYEAMLLDKVYKMAQIGGLDASADIDLLKKIQGHTAAIQTLTIEMIEARKKANRIENARAKAIAYHDTVEVYFEEIRRHIDKLEEIIDDQMWTLPKYRELLFIK